MSKITVAELNKIIEEVKGKSYVKDGILYLGELLEIKPILMTDKDGNQTLEGYDIYRYADQELMEEDEDYDFDADYITTVMEKE